MRQGPVDKGTSVPAADRKPAEPDAEDEGQDRRHDEVRDRDTQCGSRHHRIVGGLVLAQRAQLSGILGVSQSARQTFPALEVKNLVAKIDFWRPAVPFIRTAFHCVLDPLGRRVVNRVVSEHKGNHGVGEGDGAWTCQRHLKALLFAQLAGLSSLREIEQALAAGRRRSTTWG